MDITQSFQQAVDAFIGFLPNLLAFLVILIIGYIVAKLVSAIARKALLKVGLDRKLQESEAHNYVEKALPGSSPAAGIAKVIFWIIFIFFLFSAIGALKIPAVTVFMNQVLAYLPNIVAAMLIFVLAAIIAGAAAAAIVNFMGDTPTGKIAATVIPAVVMVIALFMILEQLKIAESIVQIAFAATIGALALGLALAFGLGGRPVAQRMLEDAYRKGQERKETVKRDVAVGRDRPADTAEHRRPAATDTTSDGRGDETTTFRTDGPGAY